MTESENKNGAPSNPDNLDNTQPTPEESTPTTQETVSSTVPDQASAPQPEPATNQVTPAAPPSPYENPTGAQDTPSVSADAQTNQATPVVPEQNYQPAPPQAQQTYQQAPNQAPQGYPQAPPPPGYQQQGQQPYQQAPGYQQQGQQPYRQAPGYQQQAPYPQPPYPPQAPQKKKVWPWVLAICLIIGVLGLGGCVGCVTCAAILAEDNSFERDVESYIDEFSYDENDYTSSYTFSLDEIKDINSDLPSTVENGTYSLGVYEVGKNKDLAAGLYFLEGSQSEEGSYMVYEKVATDEYEIKSSVAYFGNYFAELSEDDIIVFYSPDNAKMYPAPNEAVEVGSPILSGCYRVGTDIPAGSYTVTIQSDTPSDASQESGVYIMKDLLWDNDSLLENYYLIAGGSHTITVTDGQYVELFGATMTPVQA
ncbi:MAG: hypothetical protein ACOYD7_01560 [Raoultibacter sp.]|jgi:hypothetical protein